MSSLLISASLKAALLLAVAWMGASASKHAAVRHQIWALGILGALLVPILGWALPAMPVAPASTGGALLASAVSVTGRATGVADPSSTPWLVVLWVSGAVVVALRTARAHLSAHRLWAAATPAGRQEGVDLGHSASVGSPMTIGILRPRILLPDRADGWPPERLRSVLLHELGHVRRQDNLVQLGAQIACALYWWNPLAWLAAARLRVEREYACDDLVLAAGVLPSTYAADLVAVARPFSRDEAAAASMAGPSGTEARLVRILDAGASRWTPGAWFRGASRGAAVTVTVALACAAAPVPGTLALGEGFVGNEPFRIPFLPPPESPDLPAVQAEVQRQLPALQQCYEERLAEKPALSGQVLIHWSIGASGEVEEQCITDDSVGDAGLVDCVNQLVKRARFAPPTDGPLTVSFPFVFTSSTPGDGC